MVRENPSGPFGVLSIDVEDWYHPLEQDPRRWSGFEDRIVPSTEELLRMLERTGNRATFFVLGCIAERHPALVQDILEAGHEVGCHGHLHVSLKRLDPNGFQTDLRQALAALRRAGAREVISYRAPYFSLDSTTRWALPILEQHGIRIDSSVFPMKLPFISYYGDRSTPNYPHRLGSLYEFPISLPIVGRCRVPLTGGFYSRFFPRSWTMFGVRTIFKDGEEPMFFVHPWEIDYLQPKVRVSRFLTFRHYYRLKSTATLLAELLTNWRWRSLKESFDARNQT